MSQESAPWSRSRTTAFVETHYGLLELHPSATAIEIRQSYRHLSKRYHPDTTDLPPEEARQKFEAITEAYRILMSPERRALYDLAIGYSRWSVIQSPPTPEEIWSRSAYLDPSDRPLSAGELFVLLILGGSFLGCVAVIIWVGLTQGDQAIHLAGAIGVSVSPTLPLKMITIP